MKKVEFFREESHLLVAHPGLDGQVVFEDEITIEDDSECLIVGKLYKKDLLRMLGSLLAGISATSGENDEARLYWALEHVARSGHWKTLDEIERWLMKRDIPFTKQVRTDKK